MSLSMDWVRCSTCFCHNSNPLSITNCGHFICSTCLKIASGPRGTVCLVCKKPCSVVALGDGSKLPKEIQRYFSDPVASLKKVTQVIEFQKMHSKLGTKSATRQPTPMEESDAALDSIDQQLKEALRLLEQKARSLGIQVPPKATGRRPSERPPNRSTMAQKTPQSSRTYGHKQLSPIRTTPVQQSSMQHPYSASSLAAQTHRISLNTPSQPSRTFTPRTLTMGQRQGRPSITPMQDSTVEPMMVDPTPMHSMSQPGLRKEIPTFGQQCNPFSYER